MTTQIIDIDQLEEKYMVKSFVALPTDSETCSNSSSRHIRGSG